jgi:branched-chain amino acid transport system substrate-binding protein
MVAAWNRRLAASRGGAQMKGLLAVAAGGCLLAGGVAACGSSDDNGGGASSGGGPVKITVGQLVPQTGPYVEFAKIQSQAFELAVKRVNSEGKVNIKVVKADEGGDAKTAVAGTERVMRQSVQAINQTGGSSTQSVAIAAAAKGTVQLGANSVSLKASGNPDGFNTLPLADKQLPLATQAFWDKYGSAVKTAAYIAPDDYDVGIKGVQTRRKFLESKGVKTVGYEVVPGEDANLNAVAGKLAQARPDVVVSDMAATIQPWAQQFKAAGYKGLDFGGGALASEAVTALAPDAYKGYLTYQNWNPRAKDLTPAAQRFVKDFKAAYNRTPDGFAAAQYDGVLMLAAAVAATHSSDPSKVADWMRTNTGPAGVTMPQLKFSADQALASPVYLTQVQADGTQNPVAVEQQSGG